MPVSADPGLVKRYSTPASLSVWMRIMPPVPVIVLRMGLPRRRRFAPGALYRALGEVRERGEDAGMAFEVSVGPQQLTINHGSTFAVTDLRGEIADGSEHGMFSNDTRFISSY